MKNADHIQVLIESDQFNDWAAAGFSQEHPFTSSTLFLNSSKESINIAKTIKTRLSFKSTSLDLKKRTDILKNIHRNIEVKTTTHVPQTSKSILNWKMLSVAASFIILIAFAFTFNQTSNASYYTGNNESMTQELVDGSVVMLNANSSIETIGKWKGINPRTVKLQNSAFFDVTEGSLFSVETEMGIIDVLGTEFYVDSDEKTLIVTVKSGKVRVTPADGQIQILEAGDRLVYTKGEGIVRSRVSDVNINEELAWQKGKIVLNDANFQELKDMLEERYGKKVEVHDALLSSKRAIQGTYPLNSLPVLLSTIETALDLQISNNDDTIIITYPEETK